MAPSTWPRGRAAVAFALFAALAIFSAPLASVAVAQSQPAPRLDPLRISPESGAAGTNVTITGTCSVRTWRSTCSG